MVSLPKKKQHTKAFKKLVKTVWDVPSSMMYKKRPSSLKKLVAVKPFAAMVDAKWQAAHTDFEPLVPTNPKDEPFWLTSFYEDVKQKKYSVMDEDAEYLKELCEWWGMLSESGDKADEKGGDGDDAEGDKADGKDDFD